MTFSLHSYELYVWATLCADTSSPSFFAGRYSKFKLFSLRGWWHRAPTRGSRAVAEVSSEQLYNSTATVPMVLITHKGVVGSGAVAAAATGCCTTALLAERLLRAVDDGVRRPSPPDTRPVGVWVAAPLVSPWSERIVILERQ